MPRISVIVPVYKVEQYLDACICSILAQTYRDFELILVDDGSPDRCGAICDEYALKDVRVRVIHQENQGLSGARNSGMDIAQGEYITFVDSDDMVGADYLRDLLASLVANNADVSCVKLYEISEQDTLDDCIIQYGFSNEVKLLSGQEAVANIYRGEGDVGITASGKLFCKELIAAHPFPVGKLNEDQFVIPIVIHKANLIASVDNGCYFYRKRSTSIMHSEFNAKRFDNVEGLDNCIRYFAEQNDEALMKMAQTTKKKVIACLVVLAESEKAHNAIPPQYVMSKAKALFYCRKYLADEKFVWYYSKLYPKGAAIYNSLLGIKRKISSIIKTD